VAFQRIVRTACRWSLAGHVCDGCAWRAEDRMDESARGRPSARVYAAKCIVAAKGVMDALTEAARDDLTLLRTRKSDRAELASATRRG